jgi:hypothetical protein
MAKNNKDITINKLNKEIERLKILNQALTDELDAIYEDKSEIDLLFEDFLDNTERVLH